MARTTPEAFNEFSQRIALTSTQRQALADRVRVTSEMLQTSFGPSSRSNLTFMDTALIGSAARETMIRPPRDLDLLAEFHPKAYLTYQSDSRPFLYVVRDALNKYRVEVVGARGQAVRLFYKQEPHVDIVPAFRWKDVTFIIPEGGGAWVKTAPAVHATFLSRRNGEFGGLLRPFTQKIKRWNTVHSRRLRSFHLEVLIPAVFKTMGNNSRRAALVFFENASRFLHVGDPAGHSGDLGGYLTPIQEAAVVDSFRANAERAGKAIEAESSGDARESIRLWRIIFGDEFPAYG